MRMSQLQVGAPVKINIHDPERWTSRAVQNLDGKTGKIVKVELYKALVEFDTPAEPFYDNGRGHKSFWFVELDLEKVS